MFRSLLCPSSGAHDYNVASSYHNDARSNKHQIKLL